VGMGTPLGLKAKAVMEAGHLVSDELLIEIMNSVFIKNIEAKGFVLDGFPRTLTQAQELDQMLDKLDQKVSLVIALEVNEEELVKRLLKRSQDQGRKDDSEEVIKNRLVQYHHHTKPLIEYYKTKGLYQEVFGEGTIEQIFNQLCLSIKP
jgi:adenylate kinase